MGFISWLISWRERENLIQKQAGEITRLDAINNHLERKLASAEGSCGRYEELIQFFKNQIEQYQTDERKTREGLLTRMGILPGEKKEGPQPELKPIKKVAVPWHIRASQLEIDSRERYYKAKIDAIEQSDKAKEEKVSSVGLDEKEQENQDIEELAK